ncbi:MAG TPA: plasmid pRiA4b ORF-3 family protein [Longimicrobiales bacterium]|nr:plasmid pRiA4b ORF-3 family protein [Longimicrobiales bacterium]
MSGGPSSVYQLKITLRAICPPIWRRFQVPADTTLDRLHLMIQWVMGWTNSHLHEFVADKRHYWTGVREWQEWGAAGRSAESSETLLSKARSVIIVWLNNRK